MMLWILLLPFATGVSGISVVELIQAAENNRTLLDEKVSGWVEAGPCRSTADILKSCIVTIVACIYTAIHLDIPIRRESKFKRFLVKMKWSITALCAPEMILGSAAQQYFAAKYLIKALNKQESAMLDTESSGPAVTRFHRFKVWLYNCKVAKWLNCKSKYPPLPSRPKPRYTMSFGFYVEMGGFVVNVKDISRVNDFVAITAKGVRHLSAINQVPEISDEEIGDRSNAGGFTKTIVCFQVFWFLLQGAVRLTAGYKLSLLEIHTMVHVGCACAMYLFWWSKPLDVEQSMLVDCSAYKSTIALMLMATDHPQKKPFSELHPLQLFETGLSVEERPNFGKVLAVHDHEVVPNNDTLPSSQLSRVNPIDQGIAQEGAMVLKKGQHLACGLGLDTGPRYQIPRLQLWPEDIKRWCLCTQALINLEGFSTTEKSVPFREMHIFRDYIGGVRPMRMSDSVRGMLSLYTLPTYSLLDSSHNLTSRSMLVAIVVLPIFYGGVHLSAWNYDFPTEIEALLWKIAGIGVMSIGPYLFIFHRFGICCTPIGLVAWVYFRVYLVVAAFISIRSAPLGVFATLPWLQALPHG